MLNYGELTRAATGGHMWTLRMCTGLNRLLYYFVNDVYTLFYALVFIVYIENVIACFINIKSFAQIIITITMKAVQTLSVI